jgi:hypothetical protein
VSDLLDRKREELQSLKVQLELHKGLPHLFAFKFYKWARQIWETTARVVLLCAANQISKSSTMIRKLIELAGNPDIWPKYWSTAPKQFWYLYPSKEVATIEFEQKWVKEFLPRGKFKEHPTYGWTAIYVNKHIHEIKFNSGVSLYFKSYAQDVQRLQSGTVHAIFADEELPVFLLDELMMRLAAVDGIFMAAFTATIGQAFWYRAIEKVGTPHEGMKDAFKLQISMYDCLQYEDGSATPWTVEKINTIKNKCSTKAQIERRVYGKFVVDSGLTYKSFRSDRNCVTTEQFKKKNNISEGLIPKDWEIYSAVDIGSGDGNHPAAMVFIAVRPDYKYGALFKCRRLDDVGTTTCEDVLHHYRAIRGDRRCACQSYDWAAKDFSTYCDRLGEPFVKAEKSHSVGEDIVNVLYKNQVLDIIVDDPDDETNKLVAEMETLKTETDPKHAANDLCDAQRYTVCSIPWDYSVISDEYKDVEEVKANTVESEIEQRRKAMIDPKDDIEESVEDEIEYYNNLYEG